MIARIALATALAACAVDAPQALSVTTPGCSAPGIRQPTATGTVRGYFPLCWRSGPGGAPSVVDDPLGGDGQVWRFDGLNTLTDTRLMYNSGESAHALVLDVLGDGKVGWIATLAANSSTEGGAVIATNAPGRTRQPGDGWLLESAFDLTPAALPDHGFLQLELFVFGEGRLWLRGVYVTFE